MKYNFDIIGVTTVWDFFNHQQQVEKSPDRSCAYLGSYECTLDGFIGATETIQHKPAWDWDAIVAQMVSFWLQDGDRVARWQAELKSAQETSLIVGRVANFTHLRGELEHLWSGF
ncbi:MAG TPA: hypothetical protein V6D02_03715 [Candidatus Obscuribacterales bacterium]